MPPWNTASIAASSLIWIDQDFCAPCANILGALAPMEYRTGWDVAATAGRQPNKSDRANAYPQARSGRRSMAVPLDGIPYLYTSADATQRCGFSHNSCEASRLTSENAGTVTCSGPGRSSPRGPWGPQWPNAAGSIRYNPGHS